MVGALALCVGLLCSTSAAWAGVGFGVAPDIPDPNGSVVVGQTNLASSLTIQNTSTASQGPLDVTLSSITLVPSCGVTASPDCPVAGFDPNVFSVSTTGVGRASTACAGTTFTISLTDTSEGKYALTPSTPVVLGPANTGGLGAECIIDYTVDVLKVPNIDAFPADAGVQTNELAFAAGTASDTQPGTGSGTNRVSFSKATPTVATAVAPAAIALGAGFQDTATLTHPAGAILPTGTVTFSVFGPDNATCTGTPAFSSTNPVNAGTTATSDMFVAVAAGTYRVVASYSGDGSYNAVTSACADPAEAVVVTAPPPPPPPPPPPAAVVTPKTCTPPPGPAPSGGVLCAHGTAAISGVTGCQGPPFNVVVSGHQIKRVVFSIDGKVVKTLVHPNSGNRYKLVVRPSKLKGGTHRVVARTIFATKSGTKSKTLRMTFTRCARKAVLPAFTG